MTVLNTIRYDIQKQRFLINLKVKPSAKNNAIGSAMCINNKWYLKVDIAAAPEDGKANKEIVSFFAKIFNAPQKNIEVLLGQTSSMKTIAVCGVDQEKYKHILQAIS